MRLRPAEPTADRRRRALPAAAVRRRAAITALLMSMFAGLQPTAAHAEEVFTSQAAAAHAEDTTWIDPPAQRAAVCIVDSGVDPNPDTTNVVARLAVDGGDGGDVDPHKHGTLMAMIASAPYNGWGMVGAAPSINVVSVRAMSPAGNGTFGLADLLKGVATCKNARAAYNIKVISLSLGSAHAGALDSYSDGLIRDYVDQARAFGLSVVAAAGNRPGPVDWPAGYEPVLAVGAATGDGAHCSFAASGPEVDLWAPGCPQDVALADGRAAWASGSSEATAYISGALAQLRGLRPGLTAGEAEELLLLGTPTPIGRVANVAAAFRAAGLGQELALGHASIPSLPSSGAGGAVETPPLNTPPGADTPAPRADIEPPSPQSAPPTPGQLPTPRLRLKRGTPDAVSLTFVQRPPRAIAQVHAYRDVKCRQKPIRAWTAPLGDDRIRTRISRKARALSIIYRDTAGVLFDSPRLCFRLTERTTT